MTARPEAAEILQSFVADERGARLRGTYGRFWSSWHHDIKKALPKAGKLLPDERDRVIAYASAMANSGALPQVSTNEIPVLATAADLLRRDPPHRNLMSPLALEFAMDDLPSGKHAPTMLKARARVLTQVARYSFLPGMLAAAASFAVHAPLAVHALETLRRGAYGTPQGVSMPLDAHTWGLALVALQGDGGRAAILADLEAGVGALKDADNARWMREVLAAVS